jgi:hypothetical protein
MTAWEGVDLQHQAFLTLAVGGGMLSALRSESFASWEEASCTFGGLVFSILASGTQDRGFDPGWSRRIFSGEKILSMPSFGRDVNPFATCRRFAACQSTL